MEHSKHFPDNFYRVTVKGLCVRENSLLMVRETIDGKSVWDLPGGGLDFGEAFHDALRRECKEEMDLVPNIISNSPLYTWTKKVSGRGEVGWFYALAVAFQVEFDNLDFITSSECEAMEFIPQVELSNLPKVPLLEELPQIFNLEDFKKVTG